MIPHKDSRLLRTGILGCGPIAQFAHLEACQKARNATVYAVCDVARDLAETLGGFYGAQRIYTDYDQMLADPALEAVLIATGDAFHVEAARRALAAGKHVLVEKPLGTSTTECETLTDLVKEHNLVFQVGHMKRFDPGLLAAREFVQQELGDMVAYKGWYCDSTLRYDATDSLHPVELSSSQSKRPEADPKADRRRYFMLAHGSHLIDTAHYLAGPIHALRARLVEREGMYCWFVDVEFANGANGHLDLTVAIRDDWHEGFHIYGTKGTVMGKIFNPWYFKPAEVRCFSQEKRQYVQTLDNRAHFYQLQLEGFADTILRGTPQRGTTLAEGIAVMTVMEAIARSVETGERAMC